MAAAAKLNHRYEQLEVLGEGGMGVVYRAYDSELRREVTLKTVRDLQDKSAVELFKKEVSVLAGMTHPNIVEIFDVGEITESGGKRPYFVMPLLRGVTLDKLIKSSSQRLTVSRCVDIVSQICRGLQAAHDAGLVHRDLKPSNLFILDDDAVKIIDFGVAHLMDAHSTAGLKGTLLYMAPEQILMKRPSPLSDQFAVAVVCFVAMTGRHPFESASREEIADAIVNRIPVPACDINPSIGLPLSQVIHKGMAKMPYQRFDSVREFAENLQKALRSEPIECFDPERIEARVYRAKRAFAEGQLGIASDILSELEAEASLHRDIAPLRKDIDSCIKQRTIAQLLDTARRCFESQEYQLALQKVQEVISLDGTNTEARSLQGEIENKRSSDQIEDWYRLALQHLDNYSYGHARDAVQNVLKIKPKEARAEQLLLEIDRREQEYHRLRNQKEQAYQAALTAMEKGELSSALTKLERVLDMDRRAPDTFSPERAAMYQRLYNEVRSQHDLVDRAYAEARRHLETGNCPAAIAICDEFLAKYPEHAMFQSLKLDAEDRHRQEVSAFVARVSREVEEEPDLGRKLALLEDALPRHPDEPHFSRSLQSIRAKRDLVESIIAKARAYESGGQYNEALDQWRILRDIYRQYPGLEFEADRVQKRKEQKERSEAKSRWVEQIDQALALNDYTRAADLCAAATIEFAGDSELLALERASQQGLQRTNEAQSLFGEARARLAAGANAQALDLLRQSLQLEPSNSAVRTALIHVLITEAKEKLESDWRAAEAPVQEVLELDPGNPHAKSLRTLIHDKKQEQYVGEVLSNARELRDGGEFERALALVDEALGFYPNNSQLLQRKTNIERLIQDSQRQQNRKQDWDRAQELRRQAEVVADPLTLRSIFDETRVLAARYAGDIEFHALADDVQTRLEQTDIFREPNRENKQSAPPASKRSLLLTAGERLSGWGLAGIAVLPRAGGFFRSIVDKARGRFSSSGAVHARSRSWMQYAAGVAATVVVLLLLSAVVSVYHSRSSEQKLVETQFARLVVQADPSDANISIFNKENQEVTTQRERLPFGEYTVRSNSPGFEPSEQRVTLNAPVAEIRVNLKPLSQGFELLTALEGLSLTLDGQPVQGSAGGQFAVNGLSDAEHEIVVSAPSGAKVRVSFVSKQGSLPELTSLQTDRLRAVVVASFNGTVKLLRPGSSGRVSAALNGGAPEEISDEGLVRTGLAAAQHTLVMVHGTDRSEHSFNLNPGPKLALFVTDQNLGSLIVDVGHPDVTLEIDGRARTPRKLQGDRLIVGLIPKDYLVRISKDGFYPEEITVSVKKGESQYIKTPLREIPKHGQLLVRRAAGAEVSVGDANWRAAGPDGSLSLQVPLGRQLVRVRKPGFRNWEDYREFQPGKETSLDVGEISLQALEAKVTFRVNPPDAALKLTGPDGRDISATGRVASLRDGKYQVSATAPNHEPREVGFSVSGGKDQIVEIALIRKREAQPAPAAVESGMDRWDSRDWKSGEAGWYERIGSGRVFYQGPGSGTFTFAALCKSAFLGGGCKMRVLVGYKGPQDYIQLEVQKCKLIGEKREAGKKTNLPSQMHSVKVDSAVNIRVNVGPDSVSVELADGANWKNVYSVDNINSSAGRFGLDNVEKLSNFTRQGR